MWMVYSFSVLRWFPIEVVFWLWTRARLVLIRKTTVTIRRSLVILTRAPLFRLVCLSILSLVILLDCVLLNSTIVVCVIIIGSFEILAWSIRVPSPLHGALFIRSFLSPVWLRLLLIIILLSREGRLRLQGRFSWLVPTSLTIRSLNLIC